MGKGSAQAQTRCLGGQGVQLEGGKAGADADAGAVQAS